MPVAKKPASRRSVFSRVVSFIRWFFWSVVGLFALLVFIKIYMDHQ